MQNRTGLDKWSHWYMRGWVDLTRLVLGLPADDKIDDTLPWFRHDNDRGWIFVNKDWGYIIGHIAGVLYPFILIGALLWL